MSSPFPSDDEVSAAAAGVTSWGRALDLAAFHGLGAALAHRLETLRLLDGLPDDARDRAERLGLEAFVLDQWNLKQLSWIREELDRAGVPFMLLKGLGLAERLHGDPAERSSRDIDLLVPAARMREASSILEERGYTALRREVFEATHFHVAFFEGAGSGPTIVELHWDVTPPRSVVRLDTESWWERARRVSLRAGELLVPPEPEELVHLAWHVFSRGVATLRDLGDVARLWAARGDRYDREAVLERAECAGAERFVREAFALAAAFWGRDDGFGGAPARRRIADGLFEPEAILHQRTRASAELRRIAYWALLPPGRTGLWGLLLESVREARDVERQQGSVLGWAGGARVLAETLRGLGACAVGMLPRGGAHA